VRIRVRDGDARSATAELIVLPVPAGEQDGRTIRELARAAGGGLRPAIAATRFSGREGQVATVPLGGARRRTLCLVGLGDRARLDLDGWRRAAGRGRRAAELAGARKVAVVLDAGAADARHLGAVVEGFRLAGYRFDNGLRVQLDVLNLFNAQTNQIEYYYISRLPGEPIDGVADRHVHPAEPLAVRLTLAATF